MKKKIFEVVGDYSMSATRRVQSPGNLRVGRSVRGSHASLQDNLANETDRFNQDLNSLQRIAVLLVMKGNKILTVSRGNDVNDKNLPGGHVEAGEEILQAAIRELWEETGLRAKKLTPVYTRVSDGNLVTTYRVTDYEGNIRSSDEGVTSWSLPEEILKSSYGEYFADVISSLFRE